jgi:hypothetical protein
MSIEWHEAIAPPNTTCGLCWKLIPEGWACCENTTDFDGPDWFHPECLEVTDSWTEEQWDRYWHGCLDLNSIQWPTYDEQGNVIAQADPPCVSCGRPRSQGCADPTACGIAAVPFSQECDATRDCGLYVCVQDVRYLIPPERWPELERLYMLRVTGCDECVRNDREDTGRIDPDCTWCAGTGKQIIAGGVAE